MVQNTMNDLYDNFEKWYDGNEKRFHQSHMSDKEIAYSWLAREKDFLSDQIINNNKGEFFDINETENCNHINHNIPSHLHIPNGKGYKHVCPGCGKIKIVTSPNIKF